MDNAPPYVIEMLHITKEFPGIKANDDITLQLKKGEIHALLGENGAGKSTLMSVLFGLYQPEAVGNEDGADSNIRSTDRMGARSDTIRRGRRKKNEAGSSAGRL